MSNGAWSQNQDQALAYAWGEYRDWAATSRQNKSTLFSWRFRVLVLTVCAAILGTLSSQLAGLQANISWLIGITSAALIAIATYLGKEILKPDLERLWVRSRVLAEALKAEIFLFRTGTEPYDGPDPGPVLTQKVQELEEKVKDLVSANLPQEKRQEGLPKGPLAIGQYIVERLDDQIEKFYRPRIREYEELMGHWRQISLIVGVLAAILGIFGNLTAAWVAVLTTMVTSVAAYLFANRYEYLIMSYQATARQLDFLKNQWLAAGSSEQDPEKRNRFVQDCEAAIAVENNAWMAKWLEPEHPSK